jgi:hypothetical protein
VELIRSCCLLASSSSRCCVRGAREWPVGLPQRDDEDSVELCHPQSKSCVEQKGSGGATMKTCRRLPNVPAAGTVTAREVQRDGNIVQYNRKLCNLKRLKGSANVSVNVDVDVDHPTRRSTPAIAGSSNWRHGESGAVQLCSCADRAR